MLGTNKWFPSVALNSTSVLNADGVVMVSAAYPAATYNSQAFYNPGAAGLRVFANITLHNGGTVVVNVQAQDPVSGAWNTIASSASWAGANQLRSLTIYPAGTVTAGTPTTDSVASSPASTNLRVQVVVSAATTTFSIGAELLG